MNINMEHKNIVATIYLKDGKAIKARDNYEEYPDVIELAKLYNDSGIDKIMILHKRKSGTLNSEYLTFSSIFQKPIYYINYFYTIIISKRKLIQC